VFADGSNDRVEVLFGDGSGGFVSDAKYDLGVSPRHAVLAHVNNDAHLDIITIHNSSRSVAVLIGNGDGTFQAPMTIDTTDRPTDATTALMNDDLPIPT
jgi:trimeric autotransporter adhesin